MKLTEKEWDKKLNIDTVGRDASMEDAYHYPYEPTPYVVLERLVESGYISQENIVVDYGCGKGRVACFLSNRIGCKVVGIDFDERMIAEAKNNASHNLYANVIEFRCEAAQQYEIDDANAFYFFNPFSVEILKSVIGKIRLSYYENPRRMLLFFYFPSDEYVGYLMSVFELSFLDEVDCSDLFKENSDREKILIFEML